MALFKTDTRTTSVACGSGRMGACLASVVAALAVASTASAIPPLQLYIEGATYDSETETWMFQPTSPTDPIRLWTIANIGGEGGKGPISNVHLAISYASGATPDFTLTPGLTDGYGGWVDRTIPVAPSLLRTVEDGSTPTRSDGRKIPNHGQFGPDTWWQEYDLGLYDETTSSIGDIVDDFDVERDEGGDDDDDGHEDSFGGQINVYEITVENADGLELHFDLYDTIVAEQRTVFAPFSHDGGVSVIPIPGAALLAIAGLGLVAVLHRKFS